MKSDPDFFYRVAAIEDPARRLSLIREQGFDCTAEEIAASFTPPWNLPPEVVRVNPELQQVPDRSFRCEEKWIGARGVLITVAGELDLATAGQFREVLGRVQAQGRAERLAVDLRACDFIDSTGLGALVEAQQIAASPILLTCDDKVRRVLTMTGLRSIFAVHDSLEDVLRALEEPAAES